MPDGGANGALRATPDLPSGAPTLEARVLVTVQGSPIPTSTDVHFILMDLTNGDSVRMNDHFKAP